MNRIEFLIKDLPDAGSARRFLDDFSEKYPGQAARLLKKEGLLSDILTVVSYSPLLATTILQNPSYISWLEPKRSESGVRDKEALSESLARFSLTNSQSDTHVVLSRFRRRELLRIFLRDIRRLVTIAEITDEISNLADAILEYALNQSTREMERRYGQPQEKDDKDRTKPAGFCIVSLGKLGSKELNYSSDIDLLFIYSAEGSTSGHGTHGSITNREYFVKLAEMTTKLVGQQTGEGAAYRVDMRLRPHGRLGALALSLADTARYYRTEARDWERQVLIRSRASAGDADIFKAFFSQIEDRVFSSAETVENALRSVRLSKEKIDLEQSGNKGFNVKLGRGGIREIEFIAQALQLAYGGRDQWVRSPHTLISLSRLADRGLIKKAEITQLSDAYDFLRHLEHILQMEHGLQTHTVPNDREKRALIARKMRFEAPETFDLALETHTAKVNRVFVRVFGKTDSADASGEPYGGMQEPNNQMTPAGDTVATVFSGADRSTRDAFEKLSEISPHFAEMLASHEDLVDTLPKQGSNLSEKDYLSHLLQHLKSGNGFAWRLSELRSEWSRFLLETVIFDVYEKITRRESKNRLTRLAEAAIDAALFITRSELEQRYSTEIDEIPFAVMALGKLGGRGMDYGSDLDLILIYDDDKPVPVNGLSHGEFYSRAVEIFVNVLSSMTQQGSLYRVDLRLRPYGKNGTSSISRRGFLDYLQSNAAIWEWLAYVKIRGVSGDVKLASKTENEVSQIIHQNALNSCNSDPEFRQLRQETRAVRLQLEKQRGRTRGREIDIKYGEGGMLDVYFLMRFLQLRDNVPDDPENRSSDFMLKRLFEAGSISADDFALLSHGYGFLSDLDHDLRLTVGRSTRVPLANRKALEFVSKRMGLDSPADLLEKLTFHRLNIRSVFDRILNPSQLS